MFYILLLFFLLGSTYCTTYGDVSGGTLGTLVVVVMLHMQLSVPTADLGLLVVTAVGQLAVVTLTLSHHTRRLASSQW